MMTWQELVCQLDQALTDKKWSRVEQTYRNQPPLHDPVNWLGRLYYLSDGGYSRIWCDDHGHLSLASESLPDVKSSWPRCQYLIAEVERDIAAAIKTQITREGRERFEGWARQHCLPLSYSEIQAEYFFITTQMAWLAWQAATEQQ